MAIDLAALERDLKAAGIACSLYDDILEWITARQDFQSGWTQPDGDVYIASQWAGPDTWTAFRIIAQHVAPAPPMTPGLLAAARWVVEADDRLSVASHAAESITYYDAQHEMAGALDALRAELAAATAGTVALTEADLDEAASVMFEKYYGRRPNLVDHDVYSDRNRHTEFRDMFELAITGYTIVRRPS